MVEEPGRQVRVLSCSPRQIRINRIFSNPSAHKHLHIIYLKYVQNEYWRHPVLSLSPSSPSIQVSKHLDLLYQNYEGSGSQPGFDAVSVLLFEADIESPHVGVDVVLLEGGQQGVVIQQIGIMWDNLLW